MFTGNAYPACSDEGVGNHPRQGGQEAQGESGAPHHRRVGDLRPGPHHCKCEMQLRTRGTSGDFGVLPILLNETTKVELL